MRKTKLLLHSSGRLSHLKKAVILDLHGFLAHNFTVADKSSMLASIELRVPLANKFLFNSCFNTKDSELLLLSYKKPLKNI